MNQNLPVGPAKSLAVYPGDKVDMEVWTYYENNSGFGTSSPALNTLITAVAGAFGGASGDFLYEVNKFNPLAVLANSISGLMTGRDLERGNPMSKADATLNLASMIPIGRVVTVGKYVIQSNALSHIFRNAAGHVNPLTATSQMRFLNLFSSVASNPNNLVPTVNLAAKEAGVQTFMQSFNRGQVWVQVRNGEIFNAGINKLP